MDQSQAAVPRPLPLHGPYVGHHFLAALLSRRDSHGLHVCAGRYSAWSLVSHTCHSPGHVCLSLSDRAHDALCILPPCQGALWAPLGRVGGPPCCHGCSTTLEVLYPSPTTNSFPSSCATGCSFKDWASTMGLPAPILLWMMTSWCAQLLSRSLALQHGLLASLAQKPP